ncbi:MAG: peptide chain release factor N(5)-glutamine methyltransferase [Luteimonas sp.]|nr:peptide chain release factor N(5)-glutamine methyltransferase [Luteimonas sp.]
MTQGSPTSSGALLRNARGRVDGTEAELLLAHVLGKSRSWLFAHSDADVPPAAAELFDALVARRESGEPVAYLTGRRGFWTLDLAVTPDTLIPRPETELLVEAALSKLPPGQAARVADLGTGSGAIALAIASERPLAQVSATDRSDAALAVALGNAEALGLRNIEFRAGDWFAPLAGERFDVIASNPPYIAEDDKHLAEGDLRFEPRGALTPGGDGLDAIRVIAGQAPLHLHMGGWLLFEHGDDQGAAVRGLMMQAGYAAVETRRDLEGRDRVTLGQRVAVGNE